jgi:protein TonB
MLLPPMDEALIYRKTKRGAAELSATHGALSSPARRVLILLDGQRTLAELVELFGAESVEHIVADLEAQGFVREVDPENALTTQPFPTLVADEPHLAPIEPPPSRSGSTWIALALLVAAGATAGGGYWFFLRPSHAAAQIFAMGDRNATDASMALPAPESRGGLTEPEPTAARELPLSGLPAVTVMPARKAPAEKFAAERVADAAPDAEVVPAADVAVVLASPPGEPAAQSRRQAERGTPPTPATVLAAAKPAPDSGPPSETGPTPSASQPLARTASAPPTPPATARPDQRVDQRAAAPTGDAAPAAFGPGGEPVSSATAPVGEESPPTIGAVLGSTLPSPAAAAGKAPSSPVLGEQVASLAPPPRPESAPAQLHQRKHDPPEFPVRAVRERVSEGHVLAHLWITPEGNVDQVDIVKATPPRVFDDAVRHALNRWTFDPPGHAVETTVELDFKM